MKLLGIYNRTNKDSSPITVISDDDLVWNILEPLANIQIFQIIKSLADQNRTFF
jgi:hypothetical protein